MTVRFFITLLLTLFSGIVLRILFWIGTSIRLNQYIMHRYVSDLQRMDGHVLGAQQALLHIDGERITISGSWCEVDGKYDYRLAVYFRDNITPEYFQFSSVTLHDEGGVYLQTMSLLPRTGWKEIYGGCVINAPSASLQVSQVMVNEQSLFRRY